MRVAGSSLLYSRLSLDEACNQLSERGFDAVDVAMQEDWAHVDPSAAAADVDATADRIDVACQSAGLDPVAMNVDAGNVPLETELARVDAVVNVATTLGVEVVTLPAASTETVLSDDLDRFRTLVSVAKDRDVTLTVETHWGTHTEDPAVAAKYAAAVPGLGYTLDPGHYVIGTQAVNDPWSNLMDDVKHVHLRQAGIGWDEIQQPVRDGRLDIEAFVQVLCDTEYDRTITIEYIDSLDGVNPHEAERETKLLRDVLAKII